MSVQGEKGDKSLTPHTGIKRRDNTNPHTIYYNGTLLWARII